MIPFTQSLVAFIKLYSESVSDWLREILEFAAKRAIWASLVSFRPRQRSELQRDAWMLGMYISNPYFPFTSILILNTNSKNLKYTFSKWWSLLFPREGACSLQGWFSSFFSLPLASELSLASLSSQVMWILLSLMQSTLFELYCCSWRGVWSYWRRECKECRKEGDWQTARGEVKRL